MLLATEASSSSGLLTFLPIILLVAAMYFLMIRPQSKRRREAAQMQSQLSPGDEVQTVGGLHATVTAVDDESITLEAAPGVNLRYARGSVARVVRQSPDSRAEAPDDDAGNSDAARTIEQS